MVVLGNFMSFCLPCPGISAHQKLDLLSSLVTPLGYEGLSVFGDCFDEVTLLDPVRFPGAGCDLGGGRATFDVNGSAGSTWSVHVGEGDSQR